MTTSRAETHLKHFTGKIQKVTICTYPDCADCVYCTRRSLCCHILWVYLFVCKLPEASPILQQRALTTEEMADVVSSLSYTPQISSTSVSRLVCSSPGTSAGISHSLVAQHITNCSLVRQLAIYSPVHSVPSRAVLQSTDQGRSWYAMNVYVKKFIPAGEIPPVTL